MGKHSELTDPLDIHPSKNFTESNSLAPYAKILTNVEMANLFTYGLRRITSTVPTNHYMRIIGNISVSYKHNGTDYAGGSDIMIVDASSNIIATIPDTLVLAKSSGILEVVPALTLFPASGIYVIGDGVDFIGLGGTVKIEFITQILAQ